MKLVVLFGVLVCVVSLGMGDEAQPAQHGSVSLLDRSSYLIEVKKEETLERRARQEEWGHKGLKESRGPWEGKV